MGSLDCRTSKDDPHHLTSNGPAAPAVARWRRSSRPNLGTSRTERQPHDRKPDGQLQVRYLPSPRTPPP
jgi:hypothetical protein